MNVDLSPWREAAELIDAIWAVRRAGRRDLEPEVVRLLDHDDPTVREEALSLLFVKWADSSLRERLVGLVGSDPDCGVRSRAAGALALTSTQQTRKSDSKLLGTIILDREEEPFVRKAAYEALHHITHGKPLLLADDVDLDEDVSLDWVREVC
jgi:HEAT repeat protein